MTASLPKPDPQIEKLIRPCALCARRVIDASDGKGGRVVVEYCWPARGNLGLVAALIPGERVEAVRTSAATRYRAHRCPSSSFSADARPPKRRCLVVAGPPQ